MKESEEVTDQKFIDVDAIFRKRGKKLYSLIPGVLIRYLERVVHQDDINYALNRLGHLRGLDFVSSLLEEDFKPEIVVVNGENLPENGRYMIASNHPLGGLDGLALMHVVGKKRRDIKFVSNDLLLELESLRELFIPVNKHGRNSQEAVRLFHELYSSDQVVLIFPAGLVSRKQKAGIQDLEWKKSFVTKAIKYQRDIIPVHIEGRNTDFFYSFANWRKRLGIKMNIEMLYLPREMFRQRNQTIKITFGKPISWTALTGELNHQQWAQKLKEHVYKLPTGVLDFKK